MSTQRATVHCQRCGVSYQADLPEPRCEFCGCLQPVVQVPQPDIEKHAHPGSTSAGILKPT
jgi:hypothetical protein